MEQVVLVDKNDNKIGLMEKLAAHRGGGHLHRAVSVLLYRKKNGKTEVLLQQRGPAKPLWPFFWSNTVCTHPRDGEPSLACAVRRLKEEMGIEVLLDRLTFVTKLLYQAPYTRELSEHELDHVFVGEWDGLVVLNQQEAVAYQWKGWDGLVSDMQKNPSRYTPWFKTLVLKKNILGGML